MRYLKPLGLGAGALAVAAALAVAGSAASTGPTAVKAGTTNLGRVLVDAHGKTLYVWAHDKTSTSTCNGACTQYWPPLISRGKASALAGVQAKLLGTSRRRDGRLQITYAGHPLYYFVNDTKPGQTSGDGLTGFGGRWDPVSTTGKAVRQHVTSSGQGYDEDDGSPLKATVISPRPGDSAGVNGTFTVDVSLEARSPRAISLLAGYTAAFNDPNAPTFHPGPNASAPGLVVLLSTTPTIANTPLQGPNTNLAGVFQINDVSKVGGLKRTFNSWIVSVPGFFGKDVHATLTVYAVNGTAPALITGNERPISNVVRESFTIAG
jgi:predicted lipoprotein with Yx(FWY)xxD motif